MELGFMERWLRLCMNLTDYSPVACSCPSDYLQCTRLFIDKFVMLWLCWNLFSYACSKGWPRKLFEMDTLSLLDCFFGFELRFFLFWAMMRPPGMMACANCDPHLSQSQE